jgi:acyl carrier protein
LKLVDLLSEILGCDVNSLPDSVPFEEIVSWDSLKHVMLIIRIESNYQIKLTAGEIKKIRNLTGVRNIIKERGFNE